MPESESSDPFEAFIERMQSIPVFKAAITEYFKKFVDDLSEGKSAATQENIRQWVKDREAI